LLRRKSLCGGGVTVGEILQERFGVDGSTSLPVDDGEAILDAGVQIEGARIATAGAIYGPLDNHRIERHGLRPVLPALYCPKRGIGEYRFRTRVTTQPSTEVPLDAGVHRSPDGRRALLLSVGGLYSGHGLGNRGQYVLGIASARAGQNFKHRG